MTADEQQARGPVAALFDAVAAEYDQSGVEFFGPIAQGLVDAVAPAPGERVADLGCGRGAATTRLAEAVRPGGTVVGLDVSEGMLAQARRSLDQIVRSPEVEVDLRVGDASDPPLPVGEFDVVTSSLVLFFLPDPARALERWVRLLAPGGRIGLATFGDQDPVWDAVDHEFQPWLPPMMRDPRVVGPQSPFASDRGMEELLAQAGAVDVRTAGVRLRVRFGTVERWEQFSRGTGQRAVWSRIPADEVPGLRARVAAHFEPARDEDGQLEVWQDIRYTLGASPARPL